MPGLFQAIHSIRCFMWQEDMLTSRFVHDVMRMVRAASSGDESGRLISQAQPELAAGWNIFFPLLFFF